MIDVVYLLGPDSKWQNNELRFSLRSLDKHMTWYRNIYVAGVNPGFLSNKVIHLPMREWGNNKEERIKNKILNICTHPDISDDFLLMMDDVFFLEPLRADRMPYYYQGEISQFYKRPGHYKTALDNTQMALSVAGLPTRYFDVHVPIIYNKTRFRQAMNLVDWDQPEGYVVHSLYCNYLRLQGEPHTDVKLATQLSFEAIATQLARLPMFSIDDASIGDALHAFLLYHFPQPCQFEKP